MILLFTLTVCLALPTLPHVRCGGSPFTSTWRHACTSTRRIVTNIQVEHSVAFFSFSAAPAAPVSVTTVSETLSNTHRNKMCDKEATASLPCHVPLCPHTTTAVRPYPFSRRLFSTNGETRRAYLPPPSFCSPHSAFSPAKNQHLLAASMQTRRKIDVNRRRHRSRRKRASGRRW